MSEKLNRGCIPDEDKFFSTDRAWGGTKAGTIFGLATYGVSLTVSEVVTRGDLIKLFLSNPVEGTIAIVGVGAGFTLICSSMGTLIEVFRPTSKIIHRFIQEEVQMLQDLGMLPRKERR